MLLMMLACSPTPPQTTTLTDAVEAARQAVAASGWDQAIGPFQVERVAHAPRDGDRATQILADATLAWFSAGDRKLVVTDAAFTGPRWRGAPDPEAADLVGRCPDVMMGEHTLSGLVIHELGHGAQLSSELGQRFHNLAAWSRLAGWEQAVGRDRNEGWSRGELWEPATGYLGPVLLHEWPEAAQRLCRGEPRGDGAYRTSRDDFPSAYARFDPLEDMAESFRLYHRDPAALAATSPPRYLALATPSAWGGRAVKTELVTSAIRPGLEVLLALAPRVALEALRVHGEQMAPHIGELARERFAWPEGSEALFDVEPFHVQSGDQVFRPDDAFFEHRADAIRQERIEQEELEKTLEAMRAWANEEPESEPQSPAAEAGSKR